MPDQTRSAEAVERSSQLLGIKLRALVGNHLGITLDDVPDGFPNGAAMMVGRQAWIIVTNDAALGRALGWAIRRGATALGLVVDRGAGVLARRARRFDFPIDVWVAEGRELHRAAVGDLSAVVRPAPSHLAFADIIESSGAMTSIEHGVVSGEVRGLEVCRVVDRPTIGPFSDLGDVQRSEGVQLEVGVGANDREAFPMLHGHIPIGEALANVVETVESHRSSAAYPHPLNRLCPERFLRWRLEEDPDLIQMATVSSAEPPVARLNLADPTPCVARAFDGDRDVVVVCSVGVDLELIPYVADVQTMYSEPVLVVVPARDRLQLTADLAALLSTPIELRQVS